MIDALKGQGALFVFDLDSTITRCELLPEIARSIGLEAEMAAMTERDMRQADSFREGFLRRVSLLQGVPLSSAREIAANVPVHEEMARFLRRNASRCLILTGNLDVWIEPLIDRLGMKGRCAGCLSNRAEASFLCTPDAAFPGKEEKDEIHDPYPSHPVGADFCAVILKRCRSGRGQPKHVQNLVIGDGFVHGLCPGKPVMSDDLFITALDPENLCRGAESLAAGLGKYPTGGKLLINRIEYEPELYPHLTTEHASISRGLWQKIWQNRGAEDETVSGMTVKVNTVFVPGINGGELADIARAVHERGAAIMNLMPLKPAGRLSGWPSPTDEEVHALRGKLSTILPQFRRCAQCRADACGLIGDGEPGGCVK